MYMCVCFLCVFCIFHNPGDQKFVGLFVRGYFFVLALCFPFDTNRVESFIEIHVYSMNFSFVMVDYDTV